MFDTFGEDILANATIRKITNSQKDIVVLDGIRTLADLIASETLTNRTLLYVIASAPTRYQRIKSRGEKSGETRLTLDEFCKQESAPNEAYISEIGPKAQHTVNNEGSIDELEVQLKDILNHILNFV